MKNVKVVSKPKVYVTSNGAFVFAVIMILYTGKWIRLFIGTVFTVNLHFQHIVLNLQGN